MEIESNKSSDECRSHFSAPIIIGLKMPNCYELNDRNKELILAKIKAELDNLTSEMFFINCEIRSVSFS